MKTTQLTQPKVDATLSLLASGFLKCNLYLDLYGSYCPLAKAFEVEQVGLTGTTIDISDCYSGADFDAFSAHVNDSLTGDDNARSDAYAMQRDEVAA